LRLRDAPDSPPDDLVMVTVPVRAAETKRVAMAPPARAGKRYQLQVGAAPDPDTRAFFGRWRSATR
jgi:hypothetical protein